MSTALELNTIWIIYLFSCTGIIFAAFCTYKVFSIKPKPGKSKDEDGYRSEFIRLVEAVN